MEVEDRQLLVIIFDVNPVWWGLKALQGKAQVTKCLDSLLVFINSYLMLRHDNQLGIIGSHSTKSVFLYPSSTKSPIESKNLENGYYEHFAKIDNSVIGQFQALMKDGCTEQDIKKDSMIAGSMAMAMCYINRIKRELNARLKLHPRLLIIKAADDATSQYMSFMNVIFAAQKEGVVIDACVLGEDSGLLQQACDMTNGFYLKINNQDTLLQYLLTAFLTDAEMRKENLVLMQANRSTGVDYRAACFCHRNLVDIGFVCSVCLSIFCQYSPICSTCETVFKPLPMALKARRKRKGQQQSRSSSPYPERILN